MVWVYEDFMNETLSKWPFTGQIHTYSDITIIMLVHNIKKTYLSQKVLNKWD